MGCHDEVRTGLYVLSGDLMRILMDHDGPDLSRPSPMLGEHSEEILRDLGYSADDIQKLAASGVTKLAAPVRKMTAAE